MGHTRQRRCRHRIEQVCNRLQRAVVAKNDSIKGFDVLHSVRAVVEKAYGEEMVIRHVPRRVNIREGVAELYNGTSILVLSKECGCVRARVLLGERRNRWRRR